MDTTPFHLILFALDIAVLGGLFLWLQFRRGTKTTHSAIYNFEKSLFAPSTIIRQPTLTWDVAGVFIFGGFGLVCFAVLSRFIRTGFAQNNIYNFNVGQCIVEGILVHGTVFCIGTAVLLYRCRRKILAVLSACCALFLVIVGFDMLYWEPYHLRVVRYEIKTSKIKKSLRIVFVSDIQTDRIGFHEINTLKKIQQQKADLIILGGDYLQSFQGTREKHLPEKFRQMLLDYPLEAPLGVYAIAGNNGMGNDADLFKDTGTPSDTRGVQYIRNTVLFSDLGCDKGWDPPIDLILLSLVQSAGGLGERGITESGNFIVMAGHFPNYAVDGYKTSKDEVLSGYRKADRAPDLMLAGHTHGGQVVLPFYGPATIWADQHSQQIPRSMWSGIFPYPNGGHALITRGSGMERGWAPRVRFFCPAEICVIDIVPE